MGRAAEFSVGLGEEKRRADGTACGAVRVRFADGIRSVRFAWGARSVGLTYELEPGTRERMGERLEPRVFTWCEPC